MGFKFWAKLGDECEPHQEETQVVKPPPPRRPGITRTPKPGGGFRPGRGIWVTMPYGAFLSPFGSLVQTMLFTRPGGG